MATTPAKSSKKKGAGRPRRASAPKAVASRQAQVRLRPDEMESLQHVMRALKLDSASDALREGLRLLVREATEVEAADEIRAFYTGTRAPVPEGVVQPSAAELEAADESQW